MRDTKLRLLTTDFPSIRRKSISTLQVNLGYLCNMSCVHCHVNAGPSRTEIMSPETADDIQALLHHMPIEVLDLTGGAPELNPNFRRLVRSASELGIRVIDRCNLTIFFEAAQETLPDFLAAHEVNVVASLPCYTSEKVEKQRGKGSFDKSIEALKWLNKLGYGTNPALDLDLVFNPQGATLPPPQSELESSYKNHLMENFGIVFNRLFTIANMPINRFGATLVAHNEFDTYMELLKENYLERNLSTVMCREAVSVDWQGYVYDCDFNQMLNLPSSVYARPAHIRDLHNNPKIFHAEIRVADHCYGCTAGQGSSCGGALQRN